MLQTMTPDPSGKLDGVQFGSVVTAAIVAMYQANGLGTGISGPAATRAGVAGREGLKGGSLQTSGRCGALQ